MKPTSKPKPKLKAYEKIKNAHVQIGNLLNCLDHLTLATLLTDRKQLFSKGIPT